MVIGIALVASASQKLLPGLLRAVGGQQSAINSLAKRCMIMRGAFVSDPCLWPRNHNGGRFIRRSRSCKRGSSRKRSKRVLNQGVQGWRYS